MRIEMPYGSGSQACEETCVELLGTLDVAPASPLNDVESAFRDALATPIGLDRHALDGVQPGNSVAIVCSDHCRKTAVDQLLPVLLEELQTRGVNEADICFLFATGSHRAPTAAEMESIVGPSVWERFHAQAYSHDPRDKAMLVPVGTTSRGTLVEINRRAMEADHLIVTGSVVLHYFGGFGGGRKAIMPGLASIETIAHNHAMNLDPDSDRLNPAVQIGVTHGNPVAEDMAESARMVKSLCLINTVLDRNLRIAGLFVGEIEAAHAAACTFASDLYALPIEQQADIVIAASPHTGNFVQTHKALYNAYQAVKPEGRIILLAPCKEGLGGEQFSKWLALGSPSAIIAELRVRAEINGQTALSTRQKSPMALFITEMPDQDVAQLGGRKAHDLQEALNTAIRELRASGVEQPTVYAMPAAAYTVPMMPAATPA